MHPSQIQLRRHAGFRAHKTTPRLKVAEFVVTNAELGVAGADGVSIQQLVWNAVPVRCVNGVPKKTLDMGKARLGRARDDEYARNREQRAAGLSFNFAPDFVGTARKRSQMLPFTNRFPGNTGSTVCRAQRMRRHVPIDTKYTGPALRKLVNNGAAYGAQSQYGR